MSVFKKLLFGLGGAALLSAGVAGTAQAHTVVATAGACDQYARQYAAAYAPQFGIGGWDNAYRYAYNQCISGGPSFVAAAPVAPAPFGLGSLVAAPFTIAGTALHAGTTLAGSALHAGATLAGAAVRAPVVAGQAVAAGTTAVFAPPPAASTAALVAPRPMPAADVQPIVIKNYRGSFEEPIR